MKELNSASLKRDAAAYLDEQKDGKVAEIIGGPPIRDLVTLAMVGFAAKVVIEQLNDLVTGS